MRNLDSKPAAFEKGALYSVREADGVSGGGFPGRVRAGDGVEGQDIRVNHQAVADGRVGLGAGLGGCYGRPGEGVVAAAPEVLGVETGGDQAFDLRLEG